MEFNNDETKDLEGLLGESQEQEVPSEPEPQEPETPGVPEEPSEPEEEEEGEAVEALTEREKALIAQFTESSPSDDSFDPSIPPSPQWETQQYNFIGENESIDEVFGDPAKLNQKMNELYNAALQRGAQMALEATYRSLPRTISTYAKQQIDTMNMVNDFYQQNQDLKELKPALARIAQKIGTEHPEYTLTQLLSESAKMARTIFKKPASSQPVVSKTPAFVGQKGGTNRVTPSRASSSKSLEDEVMELIR